MGPLMITRQFARFAVVLAVGVLSLMSPAIHAESGHARIIRLSLVQGDVRFTRDAN